MEKGSKQMFVNKPFYKRFCKCTGCGKRKIWTPMAKCSGCKAYCHRRCTRLHVCFGLNQVESTVQTTAGHEQNTVLTRPDEDLQDLSPANGDSVDGHPKNCADVSCEKTSVLIEQRPYDADDGDLVAVSVLLDQDKFASEAVADGSVSDDVGENAQGEKSTVNGVTAEWVPDADKDVKCDTSSIDDMSAESELDADHDAKGAMEPTVDGMTIESIPYTDKNAKGDTASVGGTSAEPVPDEHQDFKGVIPTFDGKTVESISGADEDVKGDTPSVDETSAEPEPDVEQDAKGVKIPVDGIPADECTADEEVQADEPKQSTSIRQSLLTDRLANIEMPWPGTPIRVPPRTPREVEGIPGVVLASYRLACYLEGYEEEGCW